MHLMPRNMLRAQFHHRIAVNIFLMNPSDKMLIVGLTVLYLGYMATAAASSHEFRHDFLYAATENEFEFVSDVKEAVSKVYVGGFQLTVEDESSEEACSQIEGQFASKTDCTCSASTLHSSSVQFGCEQKHNVCNPWDICGRPVYAGIVDQETPSSSSSFCVKNLRSLREQNTFGDLCVTVNFDQSQEYVDGAALILKRCTAQLGRTKCSCTVCGGGNGLRLDCSETSNSLTSTQCDKVSLVTTIKSDNLVQGYFPSFQS
jgi:hypothetical protein